MKNITLSLCASCLLLIVVTSSVPAMMPNPNIIIETQPDGQQVQLRFKGSMHLSWHEDLDGYPVIYVNGTWIYQLSPDPAAARCAEFLEVGKVDPKASGVRKFTWEERLQFKGSRGSKRNCSPD